MSRSEDVAKHVLSALSLISPRLNTQVAYLMKFGRWLDLSNPVTLNEKVLWLKFNTYWENQLVRKCADKFKVREYVTERGCAELLCPLIATYRHPEEIDWAHLPDRFALKLNVGCGRNLIVIDSSAIDVNATKKTVKGWMHDDAWRCYSEMQYKGVPMVLLMEECLSSADGEPPLDYKFYCMNGKAKYVMVCVGRGGGSLPRFFYFDRDWNLMPFTQEALDDPDFRMEKPEGIEEAFRYAEMLSEPFPFVRTDLYIVDGRVYFGELTFTPSAGLDKYRLPATDRLLGEALKLPVDGLSGRR